MNIKTEFLAFYEGDLLLRNIENSLSKHRILKNLDETLGLHPKVLNVSPFFWNQVMDALETDMVISASRLYDVSSSFRPRSDINIPKFLDFIKKHFEFLFNKDSVWERNEILTVDDWKVERIPILDIKTIEKDFLLLEEKKELILRLMLFRDKSYAHTDRDFARNRREIVKNNEIRWSQIEELILMAYSMLKKYRLSFDGSNYLFPVANLNDFSDTLDILLAHANKAPKF